MGGHGETRPLPSESHPYGEVSAQCAWAWVEYFSPLGMLCLKRNEMQGFELFWKAWPTNPRKGAKAQCLAKWKKFYCETCYDQIIKHVEWMKTTEQWKKDNGAFIPAPLVYLNQQRWDGAEIPEVKQNPAETYIEKLKKESAQATPMPDWIREKWRMRV